MWRKRNKYFVRLISSLLLFALTLSGCSARTEVSEETAEILQFALDMAEQSDGVLDPTISPVITAWGLISGEYHIPTESELEVLLQYVDYRDVVLEDYFVTIPDGMQLDPGSVGKGYTGDIISKLLIEYEGRVNTIQIQDHRIRMLEADCPDHTCVHMGWLDSGVPIVCLPNHLVIQFSGQENDVDVVVN